MSSISELEVNPRSESTAGKKCGRFHVVYRIQVSGLSYNSGASKSSIECVYR
ncbi:unnamed protein product [Rhodiola kirilowii]